MRRLISSLGSFWIFRPKAMFSRTAHGHVRPEGVGLEHQVQSPLAGLGIIGQVRVDHFHAVDGHDAALGLFQARHHAQGGGLAAAGGSQQGHEVAILDHQVDVAQNMVVAVKLCS